MNTGAFPRYEKYSPAVPVFCLTPETPRTIHRFFDTSPVSPDGRYLAVLQLPVEGRNPLPGERADVLLVDLETGAVRKLDDTAGWGVQVGANVQWSPDGALYYNDVKDGRSAVLVQYDVRTGVRRTLGDAGVFMLSPDGRYALTHNLVKSRLTQTGYGVWVDDAFVVRNGDHPEDDGFYCTDTETGETALFMPLSRLIDEGIEKKSSFHGGEFYGFQCKWSPDGKRIMYVVRWLSGTADVSGKRELRPMVFTSDSSGNGIRLALHYREWQKGGHHVNWHPDSVHITMNLRHNSDHLRFVSFRYDGGDLKPLLNDVYGSGHPTVSADGTHILTDAYTHDLCAYPDGTTPIRSIDLRNGTERELVRILTDTGKNGEVRLDPHPAWTYDRKYVIFNGFDGGTRKVYAADVSNLQ